MEYVLGVDAGGTKYLIRACDLQGNLISEYKCPANDHHRVSVAEATAGIRAAFDALFRQMDARPEDCRFLVVGSSGIDSPKDQETVDSMYRALQLPCPFIAVNDVEIALYAATGGIGALVIGGTGSIAAGVNSRGETTRSGGWGLNCHSDQGSGYDISMRALHYVTLYYDKIIPISPMIRMLIDAYSLDLSKLASSIRQFRTDRMTLPGIPALVDRAFDAGDPYAEKIILHAANELAWLGETIVTKLHLDEEPSFKMAVWGGVALKSPHIYPRIKQRWMDKYSNVCVIYPELDAAAGAIRMALEMTLQTHDHTSRRYHVEI